MNGVYALSWSADQQHNYSRCQHDPAHSQGLSYCDAKATSGILYILKQGVQSFSSCWPSRKKKNLLNFRALFQVFFRVDFFQATWKRESKGQLNSNPITSRGNTVRQTLSKSPLQRRSTLIFHNINRFQIFQLSQRLIPRVFSCRKCFPLSFSLRQVELLLFSWHLKLAC